MTRSSDSPALVAVLGALYVMEGAVLLCAMVLYKNGNQPLLLLLTGRHGAAFVGGVLSLLVAGAYLILVHRRTPAGARREFWFTVAMNVVTVMVLLILGETTIRLFASRTSAGIVFADTVLLPRSWDNVIARNRELLEKAPSNISYFIPDELLGWTIGPSRQSKDGLYSSSLEGIRSAAPGVSYALGAPSRRIALVGDSYTFSLEVRFEESWGYRLQQDLGAQIQVLNFGVDGYGVDQAYLRYLRDVRPWHPDIVILGFINHDLYRSMAVYSFVSFPEWEFPFAKPRFAVDTGKLKLLNTPVPGSDAIFARRSIAELPFIEYDPGYHPDDWRWRPYYRSFLVRFLLSRFPRWPKLGPLVSDEAVTTVNREILASFVNLARAEGSTALIVYFPNRGDFSGDNRDVKEAILSALRQRGIEYEDLTRCLGRVSVKELFIEGHPHYSPSGNAAVTNCLSPAVRQHLSERPRARVLSGSRAAS